MGTDRSALLVTFLAASVAWGGAVQAEEAPTGSPPELLYQRALVLRAQGMEGAGQAMVGACDGGSPAACLDAARAALEAGELEGAEEHLRTAQDAAPEDVDVRRALATVMARRGNLMWAERELRSLEGQGEEVSFELGYCLHQLDEHDQAAPRLAAAAERPDAPAMAALYAASSLAAMEERERALRYAELAARSGDDPAVAAAARELAGFLRGAGTATERVLFTASASVSAGYDSNPVLGPDELPSHAGGARMWFRAVAFGEPLGGPFWALGARVSAARDQSFAEAARPFDYSSFQARAHARFTWGGRAAAQELRVAYSYSIGLLDGGDGVEEQELYAYSESHLGELAYTLGLADWLSTRIRTRSGWTVFHNRARTGMPLLAALGANLLVLEGQLKLIVEGGFQGMVWSRAPRYERSGPMVLVAASWLTPLWDLELLATWHFTWSLYPRSTGVLQGFDYARPELRRLDTADTFSVELARSFLDRHLRVIVRYRFSDSTSTIDTFDFSRHLAELAVMGGY